ncbi:hypothetical protein AGRA3207_002826 [Actinomadura graeca]|uniref:Uncharacterized protein n=1 Tax=Actinomadura graeca TaxID=2750812 RepID=A0ABX8QSX1_9ACTN|nr:hypothetical protein [Actinomadura graeca]QXJ21914.1 hypothetical protein AGRA3207_002826 [Actinomadura graeca]
MPDEGPGAEQAERAARLLGYLRDLARARRRPARNLDGHDQVHWLAGLPGDVYVEADAGPGDVLFSVPVIPLAPPGVLEEFDGWLGLRHWYRLLRDLAEQAPERGHEVVLAAGLLAWRPGDGAPVHDHLLHTPVRIVVDERTERVDVVLAGHTTLRDRELLAHRPEFRPVGWVSDAVQAGQGFGLNASVGDVLRKWCSFAIASTMAPDPDGNPAPGPAEGAAYREDWAFDPGASLPPVPRVRLAPALVVRPPGRAAVAGVNTEMIGMLANGTPVPEGLARFIARGGGQHVRHVEEAAPHTARDFLAAVLVRGMRVLVATSGTAASEALRAALPPGLAGLTVADPAAAGEAATAVLARAAAHDPSRERARVAALAEREQAAELEAAGLRERLRDAEESGATDLGSGYRGGLGELARRLRAEAPEMSWMPVRPGLPPGPPISRAEAAELVVLLAEETPARKVHGERRDVDPGALPSAAYVRTLIEAEAVASERAARSETDLSRRLRERDPALLARLDGAASVVAAALRDLGLDGHPGGWNPADLAVRAFGDALAHRRPLVWTRVAEMAPRARWAERAAAGMADRRIELPPGELHLRKLAGIAQDLRAYLADGGSLKRGPLRSAAQRQAEVLLGGATVDGAPPTTPELLDLVFTELMIRMTCQELQYVWEAAGISFPADPPPADRLARFVRAHARLGRVRDAMPAVNETVDLLDRSGMAVPLNHPLQWHGYVSALDGALEGLGVNRAAADLDALRDSIGPAGADDPPELEAALAAIDARDAAAYGRCLGALAEARHERSLQLRCEELLARVRAVHPDLANLLAATDGDDAWRSRTKRWDEAWAWARASGRLAETVPSPAEERLSASLADAEARLRAVQDELASARAWNAALAALPPGAPSSAPSEIVPGWILPLWRVPEALPPRPGSFDVVIVDGEHGAGAEGLFLLWLAPRLILVGPSGPDLPEPEGPVPATPLPPTLRGRLTPTTPLFRFLTSEPETAGPSAPEPRAPAPRMPEPDVPEPRPAPEARPEPVPEPVPEPIPEQAPVAVSEPAGEEAPHEAVAVAEVATDAAPFQVRRGRSIVGYKRSELVELVARIAAREPDLTDEQIVELARRLLACPPDEALLVGARLRYAVEAYREGS